MPERSSPTIHATVYDLVGKNPKRVTTSTRVVSLTYEDTEARADKASLTIDNFDLSNFDDPIWAQGNEADLAWGYVGNMSPTRRVKITSVKGSVTLAVEALDLSIKQHQVTADRTFHNMTRAQVVAQLATLNGYAAASQHIQDTKIVYDTIVQARETDAAFAKRLAAREGYEFFVDFDGYHWHQRKLGQRPVREYVYYTDPRQGDLLSFHVENDVTARPAQVVLAGYDPIAKTPISATGDNAHTARTALAAVTDIFTTDSLTPEQALTEAAASPAGAAASEAGAFVGRTVNELGETADTGELGQQVVAHTTEQTQARAKRQVDGAYRKSVMTVDLTFRAVGDPNQLAKTTIALKGLGQRLSGNYYVTKVRHSVGAGYQMEVSCKRDGRSSLLGAPTAAKADGKVNAQGAGDGEALTPIRTVDELGNTATQYRDTRGRSQGGNSDT